MDNRKKCETNTLTFICYNFIILAMAGAIFLDKGKVIAHRYAIADSPPPPCLRFFLLGSVFTARSFIPLLCRFVWNNQWLMHRSTYDWGRCSFLADYWISRITTLDLPCGTTATLLTATNPDLCGLMVRERCCVDGMERYRTRFTKHQWKDN